MSDAIIPTGMLGREAQAIRRAGALVTIRNLTVTPGPVQLSNPPTLDSPVIDGDVSAGATVIAIRGGEANGAINAGDQVVINNTAYLVASQVTSRAFSASSPGFDAIKLTTPLAAAAPDGTAVSFVWAADQLVYARIDSYPSTLIDGTMVEMEDVRVTVAALGLSPPNQNSRVIINGDIRTVVSRVPNYFRGTVISWELQAR